MQIIPGDLNDRQVIELVKLHIDTATKGTARCSAHALGVTELKHPDLSFWTAWNDGILLGCGALKYLATEHGEIKSMHTATAARGKGVASSILTHLVELARSKGMNQLSLETGVTPYFAPARLLYEKFGFRECQPFHDYKPDPNSLYMTMKLEPMK